MMRPVHFLVCLFVLATMSQAQLLNQSHFPAFKVGDKEFSKGRIDSAATFIAMQQSRGQQVPPEAMNQVRQAVVQELVVSELLKLEAKALKLEPSKGLVDTMTMAAKAQFRGNEKQFAEFLKQNGVSEKEFRSRTKEQAMVEALVRKIAPNPALPTEAEMQTFFKDNKKLFPVDDSIAGVRIILKTDGAADDVKTKTQFLEGLGAQVKLKKANLMQLAAQYSDEEEARKTGGRYLADLSKVEKKFADMVKKMKVGDVSEVVRTKDGLVLFLLEARNDGDYKSYESRIAMNLMMQGEQKKMAKLGNYVQELAKKYEVKFFDKSYQPADGLQVPQGQGTP